MELSVTRPKVVASRGVYFLTLPSPTYRMATPIDPQITLKRRLLKPLPTPGAGKRVRAQKQAQPVGAAGPPASSETKENSELNEDNLATPKASTRDLPLPSEASTPKVPVIQLNENPLPESSDIKASLVIDEAKDAELREKLLKLQLRDPPKPIIPKLKIPRESKVPPTPIQRRMARVKPTVKSAPRPEISFGTTVTTFGVEPEKTEKEATEKDSESAPVNLKALKRRQDREKRERLGISRTKRPLPTFSLADASEGEGEDTKSEKGDTEEDIEEKRRKTQEKMKQITIFLARDIQKWRIPKKKLKEMAKGKTDEETAARKKVLAMAWKIAKRQQQKEKERTKDVEKVNDGERETVEDSAADGPKENDAEADVPELDKAQVDDEEDPEEPEKQGKEKRFAKAETRRKAKGKERAPGWSSAPTAKPSK